MRSGIAALAPGRSSFGQRDFSALACGFVDHHQRPVIAGAQLLIGIPQLSGSSSIREERAHLGVTEKLQDKQAGGGPRRRRWEGVEPSGERDARQAGFEDRWGHRAPSSSSADFTCREG